MAELSIKIEVDATQIVNAYKRGLEDMFMMMSEFDGLEEHLNENNIDGPIDI